jgi:hypothetical protein
MWVDAGQAHDCWTTTEQALTQDLSEDLRDAWARLREAASDLGEQRIYASHNSIMFARKTCYAFVRPKRNFLELCIFLGRTERSPRIRRSTASSRTKVAHIVHIRHRDEVEAPLTDWLREAYHLQDAPTSKSTPSQPARKKPATKKPAAVKKPAVKEPAALKQAATKRAAKTARRER